MDNNVFKGFVRLVDEKTNTKLIDLEYAHDMGFYGTVITKKGSVFSGPISHDISVESGWLHLVLSPFENNKSKILGRYTRQNRERQRESKGYKKLSDDERERIIKIHLDSYLFDKITSNIKKYTDNDVYLAVKLAYAACGENTKISEYNNILLTELENTKDIPQLKNKFAECVNKWHDLPTEKKEEWRKKAKYKNITGFNMFVSVCQLKED